MRASAINAAGTVLSQPTRHTRASKSCACAISSIESAITSRETSDARMPGVPCDWLSETAIVLNGNGTPPARRRRRTRAATARAGSGCTASSPSTSMRRRRYGRRAATGRCPSHGSARGHRRARALPRARRARGGGARRAPCAPSLRRPDRALRETVGRGSRGSGLLSTADINGAILDARADDAPFEVVAVGSRDAARAEAYAHEHGIPSARTAPTSSLLADPEVDAVYIALPNALHHEWTMRALAAAST